MSGKIREGSNRQKNTKNWYTIDALGAIFAIFDTSDNFDTLTKFEISKILWDLKILRDLKILNDLKTTLLQLLLMLTM